MRELKILDRKSILFKSDIETVSGNLNNIISESSFLVVGGGGTIGQATVKEIFIRNPKKLLVVDISENNLVELVRDLRSTHGYIDGEFDTFALDCGSEEFERLYRSKGPFDYVLNLSALKHVRSEKDEYTLKRMVDVNIKNSIQIQKLAEEYNARKLFCVSTDKAANPANMMGASKRIMEIFLQHNSKNVPVSMARFANVAFSDGSLLHGFISRVRKQQPISAPNDTKRYFITEKEAGRLCMMSTIFGKHNQIFFPNQSGEIFLQKFVDIASRFLRDMGLEPKVFATENEARRAISEIDLDTYWPCYFFKSDTTGEKPYEEFYTSDEEVDNNRFSEIGIINLRKGPRRMNYDEFIHEIDCLWDTGKWTKEHLVQLFHMMLPNFEHIETGKNLNQKM
jgi:FlaA1/EpsC-like NDP-sugar epimerase